MTNEELNTALYKKVFAEQEKYREWLLSQPPDEILNRCYEYTVREDIVLALEEYDLSDKQCKALLKSPSPLAHAVCTPFIGSLCGKLLTGTNTPFAMSSARMAAFLASISAFFRFLILSSYRFCAPLAFRFK